MLGVSIVHPTIFVQILQIVFLWCYRYVLSKVDTYVTCSNEMSRMSAKLISRKHCINMQRWFPTMMYDTWSSCSTDVSFPLLPEPLPSADLFYHVHDVVFSLTQMFLFFVPVCDVYFFLSLLIQLLASSFPSCWVPMYPHCMSLLEVCISNKHVPSVSLQSYLNKDICLANAFQAAVIFLWISLSCFIYPCFITNISRNVPT